MDGTASGASTDRSWRPMARGSGRVAEITGRPDRGRHRHGRAPMRDRPKELRCAIYTRKSSEEGLEQDFNSLHAQREACEAYVRSQKHEGWTALPTAYDDGGFSGGS